MSQKIEQNWDSLKMPEEEKDELGITKNQRDDKGMYYQSLLDSYEMVDGKYNYQIQKKSLRIMDAQSISNDREFLSQEMNKIMVSAHFSNIIYQKILIIDFVMMILSVASIMSSIIYYEKNFTFYLTKEIEKYTVDEVLHSDYLFLTFVTLSFCTISTVFLMINCYMKYKLTILFDIYNNNLTFDDTLISSGYWKNICFEWLIIILHPNLAFTGNKFNLTYEFSSIKYDLVYGLNDLFVVFQFFRVFFIFQYILSLSMFKTSRSARICKMFGEWASDTFAIRCFFDAHPFIMIFMLYSFCLTFFSFTIRIFERVYTLNDSSLPNFDRLDNCVWCVFITMMTVGYGDYYPSTTLGRIVMFICSLSGIIFNSLVTVAFFKSLEFSSNENKAYLILQRLKVREEINSLNKEIIRICCHNFVLRFKNKKTKDIAEIQKNNQMIIKLKRELSYYVKRTTQIKRKMDITSTTNYVLETVIDDFMTIAEDFKDIGKTIIELSEKLNLTNKYDRNMINYIKKNLENKIFKKSEITKLINKSNNENINF